MSWIVYLAFNLLAACGLALAVISARRVRPPRLRAIALIVRLLPASALLAWAGWAQYTFVDFRVAYYEAGRHVPDDLTGVYKSSTPHDLCVEGFVNIPIVAWEYAPLGRLDVRSAILVFTLAGLGACFLVYRLLIRRAAPDDRVRAAALVLLMLSGPLFYSLSIGNVTHFILLILLGALACLERGWAATAGALLAAAVVNKPPLLVFAPFLLLRGEVRAVISFLATLAAIGVGSIAMFGLPMHELWMERCIVPYAGGVIGAYNNSSIAAALARLFMGVDPYVWQPVKMPTWLRALWMGLVAATVAIPVLAAHRGRATASTDALRLDFAATITIAVLISPLAWSHYQLLLLLPLVVLVDHALRRPRPARWLAGIGISALLLSQPVVVWRTGHEIVAFVLYRILLGHYTIGAALVLLLLACARASPAAAQLGRAGPRLAPEP